LALPDVPTVAEAALKGYEATNWYGYVVPPATPRPIIERLHKATVTVLEMTDVKQALLDQGIEAVHSTPEQFAAYIKSETGKWTQVIKTAGVKVE
jgi:tripartite-type tricarboxylate transporter receptor subunit TctC